MPEEQFDWQLVVDRKPRGYLELNDTKWVVHGPVESVAITDNDFVEIKLKWGAKAVLGPYGIPSGDWEAIPDGELTVSFPNLVVPFVIEQTPEKGERVRYAFANILYFDPVEGLDPAKVRGLDPAKAR